MGQLPREIPEMLGTLYENVSVRLPESSPAVSATTCVDANPAPTRQKSEVLDVHDELSAAERAVRAIELRSLLARFLPESVSITDPVVG